MASPEVSAHRPRKTSIGSNLPWKALRENEDPQLREEIIEACLPFARMLAAKLYARRTYPELEFHDYFQHASIGLIEAVDRFDPQRDVEFEAYAASRITGAILNGIESLSEKQKQVSARKRIVASRVDSLKEAGAEAADPEMLFTFLADLAVGLAVGFVLDGSGEYSSQEAAYPDNTYDRVELRQLRGQVHALVEQLTGNERRVVIYHYFQHLAFEEIASMLQISKGRVSQLHKEALKRLKNDYGKDRSVDLSF